MNPTYTKGRTSLALTYDDQHRYKDNQCCDYKVFPSSYPVSQLAHEDSQHKGRGYLGYFCWLESHRSEFEPRPGSFHLNTQKDYRYQQ